MITEFLRLPWPTIISELQLNSLAMFRLPSSTLCYTAEQSALLSEHKSQFLLRRYHLSIVELLWPNICRLPSSSTCVSREAQLCSWATLFNRTMMAILDAHNSNFPLSASAGISALHILHSPNPTTKFITCSYSHMSNFPALAKRMQSIYHNFLSMTLCDPDISILH